MITHSDGRVMSIAQWAAQPEVRALGISRQTLRSRMDDPARWPGDTAITTRPCRGMPPTCLARRSNETPLVDRETRYVDDIAAQLFVATYPDGCGLGEIGDAFGFTRERARQIESEALHSFRARCALMGINGADLAHSLAARRASNLAAAQTQAETNEMPPRGRTGGVDGDEAITDGPLADLEAALSAVEARATFVVDVTRRATRHA